MQIIGFPLNYIENYSLLASASIVYSIILIIGIYQKVILEQDKKMFHLYLVLSLELQFFSL